MTQIRAVRGMNDILPDETPCWQFLEHTVRTLLSSYGYAEIRLPKRSVAKPLFILWQKNHHPPFRNHLVTLQNSRPEIAKVFVKRLKDLDIRSERLRQIRKLFLRKAQRRQGRLGP